MDADGTTSAERLEILETKLAFQDRTVDALNEVVTRQQDQIDELIKEVARLLEKVDSLDPGQVEAGEEPPPPHY